MKRIKNVVPKKEMLDKKSKPIEYKLPINGYSGPCFILPLKTVLVINTANNEND